MSESELLDYLQLSYAHGVGPSTFLKLVKSRSEASQILEASSKQLRAIHGIGDKLVSIIHSSHQTRELLQQEIQACQQQETHIVLYHDQQYPSLLKQIPSPPPVLFCKGNLQVLNNLDSSSIAIVGTRHPTHYGKRIAHKLACNLSSRGYTIVSGLARGIDRVAHEAALSEFGPTIAVLGSGLEQIYPASHSDLALQIQTDGLLISEVLPSSPPHSRLFPRRNRIISGLSLATLVVEAALRSGALITARHATEQNREILAVPGMVDTAVASGCNKLIKDGAQLVESYEDILAALPFYTQPVPVTETRKPLELSPTEQVVLELIPDSPTLIDLLPIPGELTTGKLLSTLTTLEFKQVITRPTSNSVLRTVALS